MDIPSGEIEASYALPEKVTWRCAAPAPRGTDEDEDRLTQRMAATIAIPITRVVAAPSACSRIATRTGRRRSFRGGGTAGAAIDSLLAASNRLSDCISCPNVRRSAWISEARW